MRVTRETQEAVADAAWALVQRLPAFGYGEIVADLKISLKQATRIVKEWAAFGNVTLVQQGVGRRKMWKVRPGVVRPETPRRRTPEDNMWTAMRGLKSFTPTDLAAHANTDDVAVAPEDAQGYCRALLAAGHLGVARMAIPGKREAIYRLVRNTGPKAPREKRVRAVIDDNLDLVITIGGGAS